MIRKMLLGAAMAVATLGAATQAAATDAIITNVGTGEWNWVSIAGHGVEPATPILFSGYEVPSLTTFTNQVVFCVDLEHIIYVGGPQALPFDFAELTVDGAGAAVSEANSNRIGRLADLGRYLYNSADPYRYWDTSAVQAAIWSIEYNTTVTSSTGDLTKDSYINNKIGQLVLVTDNGRGRARIFQSVGHVYQNQTSGGVPEPASWALMIGGFGMAGGMLRRRRAELA
jgi:hypothetical protein